MMLPMSTYIRYRCLGYGFALRPYGGITST